MTPELEQAVMKESAKALKELVEAFVNVGLPKASISFMLREKAEELSEKIVLSVPELPN